MNNEKYICGMQRDNISKECDFRIADTNECIKEAFCWFKLEIESNTV